ncbi:hypothetical protein [Streptomyces sp. NPDC017529]|uniref:hypothetical protein n=1 Tax=Streptomyces sp. NPDC017529 TaxID=3365000 RepID=UPI0037B1759D
MTVAHEHEAELLRAEIEVNWPPDARGRLQGPHHAVLGVTADGRRRTLATGAHLPDALAAWAMALAPGSGHPSHVVSVCHTSCRSDHGAEAGLGTLWKVSSPPGTAP